MSHHPLIMEESEVDYQSSSPFSHVQVCSIEITCSHSRDNVFKEHRHDCTYLVQLILKINYRFLNFVTIHDSHSSTTIEISLSLHHLFFGM